MDSETSEPNEASESKQITIEVPAQRLAEFYAFFGRFLAGDRGRGRRAHRGGGPGHYGHHSPHRCSQRTETTSDSCGRQQVGSAPPGTTRV